MIQGLSGRDTLVGGAGDDQLIGGSDADTYEYNAGDGDDIVIDSDYDDRGLDVLRFGPGITAANLVLSHGSDYWADLKVSFNNMLGSISIQGQWWSSAGIELLKFADGTVLNQSQFAAMYLAAQTTSGDDVVTGTLFDDQIVGGVGNDELHGWSGVDILTGGTGDDRLYGDSDADTYVYNVGDGNDVVFDSDYDDRGQDAIQFGPGIVANDLVLSRGSGDWADVRIAFANAAGSVLLQGQWSSGAGIELLRFADGTVLDQQQFAARYVAAQLTSGDDMAVGTPFDDTLDGGSGNDELHGWSGADILTGGTGDDRLYGDSDADTYVYNVGDGNDVIVDSDYDDRGQDMIQFGPGIVANDLLLSRGSGDWADVRIAFANTAGSVLLQGQWSGGAGVELLNFADGTVLDQQQFAARYVAAQLTSGDDVAVGTPFGDTLDGSSGNDELHGWSGADVLTGDTGDDRLYGDSDADTYVYNVGDGNDVVFDSDYDDRGQDVLRFGQGIVASDLVLTYPSSTQDVLITFKAAPGSIRLQGQDRFDAGVELFSFTDGTVLTQGQLEALATPAASTPPGTIDGTPRNDRLFGTQGPDLLHGGAGDDYLEGREATDEYLYGSGDGNDEIADLGSASEVDALRLTDLNPTDVELRRDYGRGGVTMWVKDRTTGQEIRIDNEFVGDGTWGVERIVFADGTTWDKARIAQEAWLRGTPGGEQMFSGGDANVFVGGRGDDYLEGNAGSDEYRYASGDGNDDIADVANATDVDVLRLTDLNPADVELRRDYGRGGVTMWVKDRITGQEIRIDNEFAGDGAWGVEQIVFADGTVWDKARLTQEAWLRGTPGGEQLFSGGDANVFVGGRGDDYLEGNAGSDEYRYTSGDGNDEIADVANATDVDTLVLTDLSSADVRLRRSGDDLYVRDLNTGSEIRVDHQFAADETWGLEDVRFSDGSVMDREQLKAGAWVRGTEASEGLDGGNFASTFVGGRGDDYLHGHGGADTYIYASGDGSDEINDEDGSTTVTDMLKLTDFNAADVSLRRDGDHLYVTVTATGETIKIDYQFYSPTQGWGVEKIAFADGTIWDRAAILNAAWVRGGTGSEGLDGRGYDTTFVGGKGNDYLHGHGGKDTYIYNSGDGSDEINDEDGSTTVSDTLKLTDLNAADVSLRRDGDHLYVTATTTGEEIKIDYQFYSPTQGWGVEKIAFADGTIWDRAAILDAAWVRGGTGSEGLDGRGYDTTFVGGKGNDYLHGHGGSDTYVYASGDGNDEINDEDGSMSPTDVIRFTDLNPSDVSLRRDRDQLNVTVAATGETIKVDYQFYSPTQGWGVEKIAFANGTEWDRVAIQRAAEHTTFVVGSGDTLAATAASDEFQVHAGFGSAFIDGFDTISGVPDTLQIDRSAFSDWAHLLGATRQVGPDLAIEVTSTDSLLLKDVSLSSFHQESVRLV